MARKRTTEAPTEKSPTKSKAAPAKSKASDTVFRLKIALNGFKPPIWRRVEVPDCTLENLHYLIQLSMPWGNCHMWSFEVSRDEIYGSDDDRELGFRAAHRVRLSDLAAREVKKLRYTYDFGDSWEHTVTFEKPAARDPKAKYPRCIAGEQASPPEDCGGVWGYAGLLEILADPNHPEHEERLEWLGRRIDPEAFQLDAVNKDLQRLKLK